MLPARPLLGALCLAALATSGAARAQAQKDAVFTGAVARDPALEGVALKLTDALGQAFARSGVQTLGPEHEAEKAPQVRVEDLSRLVGDAQGRFFDGDFEGAVTQAEEGLKRFELGFAYRAHEEAWALYSELQIIRVLALLRLDEDRKANRALRELAAKRPLFVPDPSVVPPKVVSRHQEILEKVKKARAGALEVSSRPAGAEVIVDGRKVGVTPLTVDDLLAGPHYVLVRVGGERHEERVDLGREGAKIDAQLGDPRASAARQLNQRLRLAAPGEQVEDLSAKVGDTVLTAVLTPGGRRVTVLLGRFEQGRLDAVTGTTVADDLSDLDKVARSLAQVSRVAVGDASIDGTPNPGLREQFLGAGARARGSVAEPPPDESEGGSTGLILGSVAVGGGVAAALLVGAAVAGGGTLYYLQTLPPNPGGTTILIDASKL